VLRGVVLDCCGVRDIISLHRLRCRHLFSCGWCSSLNDVRVVRGGHVLRILSIGHVHSMCPGKLLGSSRIPNVVFLHNLCCGYLLFFASVRSLHKLCGRRILGAVSFCHVHRLFRRNLLDCDGSRIF